MPQIPCCIKSLCDDPSNPFSNLTAEAPDSEVFISYNTGWENTPPLGSPFGTSGCISYCTSQVSQADADLCAARQQLICSSSGGGPGVGGGGDGGGGWTPGGNAPRLFSNNIATCTGLCADGSPFTYQVAPGLFVGTSQAQADAIAVSYACTLVQVNKVCLSALNRNGCVGTGYAAVVTATGIQQPFTFSIVSGSLPPGLQMIQEDNFSVIIVGTPTATGTYSFTIRVQNVVGNFMQKTYTIVIMGLTNSPPAGTVNSSYTFQFSVAGGTPPYTFALVGSLPAGLTMTSGGLISGTPTTAQTANFTVAFHDSTP
jgi:hypothetical protein